MKGTDSRGRRITSTSSDEWRPSWPSTWAAERNRSPSRPEAQRNCADRLAALRFAGSLFHCNPVHQAVIVVRIMYVQLYLVSRGRRGGPHAVIDTILTAS